MEPLNLAKLDNHIDFGYFQKTTQRKNIKRSLKDKIKAWQLDQNYYDGERSCGYGGFYDDGRWTEHLPKLINLCGLRDINK